MAFRFHSLTPAMLLAWLWLWHQEVPSASLCLLDSLLLIFCWTLLNHMLPNESRCCPLLVFSTYFYFFGFKKASPTNDYNKKVKWQFLWAVSEQGTDSFARIARSPSLSLGKLPNRLTQHNVCLNAEQHHVASWLRCSYQRAHSPVWEWPDPPDTLMSCCLALFPASTLRKFVKYAWLFASPFIMELFSTLIYFLFQYHLSQSLSLMAFSFSVAENDICSGHTVVTAQLKMSWVYWWHGLFLWRVSFNFIMRGKCRAPIIQQLH